MMNKMPMEFLDHAVVIYLDDTFIYSDSMKEHIRKVQEVVDIPEQYDLAVPLKKSVFHLEQIEFLGYIVKSRGVTMTDRKIKSI